MLSPLIQKSAQLFPEIMQITFSNYSQMRKEAFLAIGDLLAKVSPQNFMELTRLTLIDFLRHIVPKIENEEEDLEVKDIVLKIILNLLSVDEQNEMTNELANNEIFLNSLLNLTDSSNLEVQEISDKILEKLIDQIPED